MKKLIASLATVGVIGIGGVFAMSQTSGEPKQEIETASVNETEETKEIPTARTVDTGPNMPWEHFATELIKEHQNKGETVYLWSDAKALEDSIIETIDFPIHEDSSTTREGLLVTKAKYLNLFINEVSQYVDKPDYFDKMQEVKTALNNVESDKAKNLISEAKQIRGSQ
ncbi:hypothetical protein AOX59_18945 [Lentibacillus amyloliquefaciens]|uniref:Uncharacterized protein n=2 Tax=Lentibacillus amyloliquefaciens TaxID=1472767 RepID=A0A0U4F0L0_9BACI|nr:hypothetical protein AOX59_00015 [Lentibacillus amyloliquefaciens]ALX50476.1 hypothetical protein AOX59_18945 [Lentibacillus amyloliquefaciens]